MCIIKFDDHSGDNLVVIKNNVQIYPKKNANQVSLDEHEQKFRDQVNWFYGQFARNGNCWV